MLNEDPEKFAVELARKSLEHYLQTRKYLECPPGIPVLFQKKAGAFVTLRKDGRLRGCIGTISPTASSAAEEIIRNAVSAATRDPRFPPVSLEEIPQITFSVDVLEKPEPVRSPDSLDPKIYGVIVKCEGRNGLLLPDIEGVDDVSQQIDIARQKAGIQRWEKIEIERFKVTRYGKK